MLRELAILTATFLGAIPGMWLLLGHMVVASTGPGLPGVLYSSWGLQFFLTLAGALVGGVGVYLLTRRSGNRNMK
jgi:hypothetical protein